MVPLVTRVSTDLLGIHHADSYSLTRYETLNAS